MAKSTKSTIEVQGATVSVLSSKGDDYISITDIARFKNPERSDDLVRNWLRNRNTIEFLAYGNRSITPVLIPSNSTGLKCRRDSIASRYRRNNGSTNPCNWHRLQRGPLWGHVCAQGHCIRVCFLDFCRVQAIPHQRISQRLTEDENTRLSLAWNLNRTLSKLNYRIHTDAVRET